MKAHLKIALIGGIGGLILLWALGFIAPKVQSAITTASKAA